MKTMLRAALAALVLLFAIVAPASAITDKFVGTTQTQVIPGTSAFAIAPNDSTDLTALPRAIYVGGAGDLKVTMADGTSTVTFVAVPAGTLLPIRVNRVFATGTTATNMVAVY